MADNTNDGKHRAMPRVQDVSIAAARDAHTRRWDRIIELTSEHGFTLPQKPDSRALEHFLIAAKAADPLRFPDLSLSVIKLLDAGEYVVEHPGGSAAGHFGLAVRDYAHSTAPNRRYLDLITHSCAIAPHGCRARIYRL